VGRAGDCSPVFDAAQGRLTTRLLPRDAHEPEGADGALEPVSPTADRRRLRPTRTILAMPASCNPRGLSSYTLHDLGWHAAIGKPTSETRLGAGWRVSARSMAVSASVPSKYGHTMPEGATPTPGVWAIDSGQLARRRACRFQRSNANSTACSGARSWDCCSVARVNLCGDQASVGLEHSSAAMEGKSTGYCGFTRGWTALALRVDEQRVWCCHG
jgi:hypothetical protein